MAYSNQGGVKNYLGKQKMVKAPLHWQSAPDHPQTELAYITDAEKKLLIKKDLHKSLKGGVHRGPAGIMSLNGWGSKDDSGREVGMSGAATSAAETGSRNTRDIRDVQAQMGVTGLAPGVMPEQARDYRSGFIAAGGGQNVNPGWFGARNRVSRDELRAARAFAPKAYRATRGNPMGNILRGALGFFGGLPGKVISGIMTAKDWAGDQGRNLWSGVQEFGEHDNLMSYLNRNKVQAIKPVESIPTNEEIIGTRIGEYWRQPSNVLPSNLTPNMGANNQMVDPNFLALGAADGGRIGYRDGLFVDENIEGPGYDFNEGMEIASAPDPMDALNDFSLEIFNKPYDQLNDEERGILHDLANEQVMGEQDQGIASLV